jgi:hypothetical protein
MDSMPPHEKIKLAFEALAHADAELAPLFLTGQAKVRLEPSTSDARVKLAMILIDDKARKLSSGQSAGRKIMETLCMICDSQGVHIELLARPLPMPHISGQKSSLISLDQLAGFYASFGFEPTPGQSSAFSRKMIRPLPSARQLARPKP